MGNAELDSIMQEHIEQFNNSIIELDFNKTPVGLFNGKMGISIYFYHQAKLSRNKTYEQFADKLLDSVYTQIQNKWTIDLENGLLGICWGILHLIENGFVKGNPNYILKDLDDKIFSSIYYSLMNGKTDLKIEDLIIIVHCSLYFCKRLTDKRLSANERLLFKQLIIRSINTIEAAVEVEKMAEPFPFSPLTYFPFIYFLLVDQVYQLDFYTYKMDKVCDEWSGRLLSSYPLLNSHRLILSYAMESVNKYNNLNSWAKHISLLKQQTDISCIISTEFRNKNLLIHNGLSGFYILSKNKDFFNNILMNDMKKKLSTTVLWTDFNNGNEDTKLKLAGLISGLSGLILTYFEINNRQQ